MWSKNFRLFKQTNIQTPSLSSRGAGRFLARTFCLSCSRSSTGFSHIFWFEVVPYYKWCTGNQIRPSTLPTESRKWSHFSRELLRLVSCDLTFSCKRFHRGPSGVYSSASRKCVGSSDYWGRWRKQCLECSHNTGSCCGRILAQAPMIKALIR